MLNKTGSQVHYCGKHMVEEGLFFPFRYQKYVTIWRCPKPLRSTNYPLETPSHLRYLKEINRV